jgi:hypothetical protein
MNICSQCGGRLLPKATNCPHCNKFVEANARPAAGESSLAIPPWLVITLVVLFAMGALTFFSITSGVFKAKNTVDEVIQAGGFSCWDADNPNVARAEARGLQELTSDNPDVRCFAGGL